MSLSYVNIKPYILSFVMFKKKFSFNEVNGKGKIKQKMGVVSKRPAVYLVQSIPGTLYTVTVPCY